MSNAKKLLQKLEETSYAAYSGKEITTDKVLRLNKWEQKALVDILTEAIVKEMNELRKAPEEIITLKDGRKLAFTNWIVPISMSDCDEDRIEAEAIVHVWREG